MKTFLDDSKFRDLATSDDPHFILMKAYGILDTDKLLSKQKADIVFYRDGKLRTVSDLIDFDDVDPYDGISTFIDKNTISSIEDYINNNKRINRVKSLIIHLMNIGILRDTYKDMNITRDNLREIVDKYYEQHEAQVDEAFKTFFDTCPDAHKISDITHQFIQEDNTSNLKAKYSNTGKTEEEMLIFTEALKKLRKSVERVYRPELRTLYELFDIPSTTYERNKTAAIQELANLL